MLLQMREGRRSDIKPLLWINLAKPEFVEESSNFSRRFMLRKIVFANYGKGAAVNIQIRYYVPVVRDVELGTWKEVQISARDVPPLLLHGDAFEDEINTFTENYELKDHFRRFFKIRVVYEDTERNLYRMTQTYDLLVIPIHNRSPYYGLELNDEELNVTAFSDRKHVRDIDEPSEDRSQLIFRRRSPA
jgi:hypothetical protein